MSLQCTTCYQFSHPLTPWLSPSLLQVLGKPAHPSIICLSGVWTLLPSSGPLILRTNCKSVDASTCILLKMLLRRIQFGGTFGGFSGEPRGVLVCRFVCKFLCALNAFLTALQWKCENLLGEKQPKFTEMSTPLGAPYTAPEGPKCSRFHKVVCFFFGKFYVGTSPSPSPRVGAPLLRIMDPSLIWSTHYLLSLLLLCLNMHGIENITYL